MVAAIDPAEIRADVDRLAAFGTRHTLSDTVSNTRGIGAARRWVAERLRAALAARTAGPAASVAFDGHRTPPDGKRIDREVEVVNVIATIPGVRAPDRRIYVVAHLDSRASDAMDADADAPGANDDGSGVALLLALARALAPRQLDATVVLLASSGEEQGLVGARAHAAAARRAGLDIRAVLSFDIVGDPSLPGGGERRDGVRMFSEGVPLAATPAEIEELRALGGEHDSRSRALARHVAMVAAWHALAIVPQTILRPDRFLRGGDHTAFNEQGYAALRFTEYGEDYDRQHQDVRSEGARAFGDTPEFVDAHYLAELSRLAAAGVIHLANAPAAPLDARVLALELADDTTLRWSAVPDDDLAGYEVLWRDSTSFAWQHVQDVGTALEVRLPLVKDEWLFGVRSYDRDGYRSEVVFAGAERRP